MQSNATADLSGSTEVRLGRDTAGNVSRSYFNLDGTDIVGKTITSARFLLYETWSATCTPQAWASWTSSAASTSTRWVDRLGGLEPLE